MGNKNISNIVGAIALITLVGCSGSGSCPPGSNSTPNPSELTLKITAPNQYPAGMSTPITAYLTMTNTSAVNASNLYYAIPDSSNYTKVAITVQNGNSNPCLSIAAHAECTFPVTIAANANPGSFTVTATPNGSSSQSTFSKLLSKIETKFGLQANTLSLTANIGLTNVPANTNSGAGGISFLYSNIIAANESGETLLSIVGVVNSPSAGEFNTINLTDADGNLLNFTVSSGNSGNGATNLAQGSIVTFLLRIPASAVGSTFNFYAQTMESSTLVDQGTMANPITVGSATSGVLVVQPTNFSLTAPTNESQTITFTNIGNGSLSDLTIPTPADPLYTISNSCGSMLAAGASCTYVVGSHAEPGFSGDAGLIASYNNGSSTATVSAQIHYAGSDPVAGISISSSDNPTLNFVSNTESSSKSSQLTLTNSGNVSESNFVFTVPQYFTLSAGTSGTSCTLSGNTVTSVLAKNDSCTLTLTYSNSSITSQQSANLLVNYKYRGVDAPQSSIPLTYQTVQASAVLQVTPASYTYPNIRANGNMSESQVFVYTNIGTGTASNISNRGLQGPAGYSIIPSQPSAANDCVSSITSLAPSARCQVTVQFGPYGTTGTYTKTLNLSYESYPSATLSTVSAALSGTVIPALSANIIVSNVSWSPTQLGGNGTQVTPFAFESSSSALTVTLTYKNESGAGVANNFTVDTSALPPGFALNNNGCNSVTLAINATCLVLLSYTPDTATSSNIDLSTTLPISWTDDRGNIGPMAAQWSNGGTMQSQIYYQIFAARQVGAVMSYESSGVNPITSVKAESDFYVVYTLTGGYNVGDMTYGVDLSNAQGGNPTMSAYNPTSCTLSGTQAVCYIKLNAGGAATSQSIGYTTTGTVQPSPANSGNFNVTGPFAYVLGTDKIYGFNYNSSTGELTANGSISSYGANSVGIVSSKDGKYLYVVDSTQSMIKSFAVNSNTGALTFIESIQTGNSPSNGSLSFDPSGKYLYSSAVGAKNITVFSYNSSTGHLTQMFVVPSGVHPSFMSFTPNGSYLYVSNDVGVIPLTDVSDSARINMYSVQANGNLVALQPESSIKSLANNPYFSVVDPSGKYLYVANVGPISAGFQFAENSITIFSINQSTGALSYNSAQSSVTVESAPVSLTTDSLGKYLYVANGVSQTISQLSINSVDGSVSSLTPPTASFGLTPVSLVFSPDRKFIYTVSQYGNFIKYYNQDPLTGQLNAIGSQISTGSTSQSVYLVFNN